ncbi:guanylate kinase [Xylanibacter brevis]|uniref:guanylate kinase n=1 Tax=Xylanibacter brevis TaxID=83231 RepID=UPI0009DCB1DD|nr:guanylate kinase [Xylanibacter brevis]
MGKDICYGYETAGLGYDLLRRFSKDNRRYMTPAESALWEVLRGKQFGYRFRRQHPIGEYIPDFVCLPKRLVIEVDGGYHYIGDQLLSDQERTDYLNQRGFEVLRLTNDEVIGNTENVIKKIREIMDSQPTITTNNNATATPLPRRGRGRLLIVSAPSGSGKSTIVQWLMKEHPELKLYFSISCTSRAPRGTEQNGVEYFFLTPEEFKAKIQNDEFLEYEEVYQDRFYGTLKQQVERQREAGQNVVFDVDVKGGINIKKFYGEEALSLFIQPPSVEELRRRLEGRATDTPEAIAERLAKAEYEMTFAPQFDHIIVNDDLEKAKQETLEIIARFLNAPELI